MANPPRRIYLDANVFLNYVNGIHLTEIDPVFDEAVRGDIELVTSQVSVVEVAFGASEQAGHQLSEETLDKINALWLPPAPTKLIEFYDLIAEDARGLIRAGLPDGRRLKPMDAIHLATARRWKCTHFYTYDSQLYGFDAAVSMTIEEPQTRTPQLPWPQPGAQAIPAAPSEPEPPSAQSPDDAQA